MICYILYCKKGRGTKIKAKSKILVIHIGKGNFFSSSLPYLAKVSQSKTICMWKFVCIIVTILLFLHNSTLTTNFSNVQHIAMFFDSSMYIVVMIIYRKDQALHFKKLLVPQLVRNHVLCTCMCSIYICVVFMHEYVCICAMIPHMHTKTY